MRVESFKRELRKISGRIQHSVHGWKRHVPEERHDTPWPFQKSRGFERRRTIRDVMKACPITVGPESSLRQVLAAMIENRISSVPVVDADGAIIGALNEKDLLKIFWEWEATTAVSLMERDPVAIAVDAPLVDLVDQLMSSDFRRVLVHESGRLVGIVTREDLMPTILETLDEQIRTRRVAVMATKRSHSRRYSGWSPGPH